MMFFREKDEIAPGQTWELRDGNEFLTTRILIKDVGDRNVLYKYTKVSGDYTNISRSYEIPIRWLRKMYSKVE